MNFSSFLFAAYKFYKKDNKQLPVYAFLNNARLTVDVLVEGRN